MCTVVINFCRLKKCCGTEDYFLHTSISVKPKQSFQTIDQGIMVLQCSASRRTMSEVIPSRNYSFQNRLHLIKILSCQSTITHHILVKRELQSHQYHGFCTMTQVWNHFQFQGRFFQVVHCGVLTQSHRAIIRAYSLKQS